MTTQPFPLNRVRLLDGPFQEAMERDGAYLLALDKTAVPLPEAKE